MVRATIKFLDNSLVVDLPCHPADLQDHLGSIGVLMAPGQIGLDNKRMVQVHIRAADETGEKLIALVSPVDTLAKLNKVCNAIYRLDYRHETAITEGLKNGRIKSLDDVLNKIEKLKKQQFIR